MHVVPFSELGPARADLSIDETSRQPSLPLTEKDVAHYRTILDALANRRPDGLILATIAIEDPVLLEDLLPEISKVFGDELVRSILTTHESLKPIASQTRFIRQTIDRMQDQISRRTPDLTISVSKNSKLTSSATTLADIGKAHGERQYNKALSQLRLAVATNKLGRNEAATWLKNSAHKSFLDGQWHASLVLGAEAQALSVDDDPNLQRLQALASYKMGHYRRAMRHFLETVRQASSADVASEAWVWFGRSAHKAGELELSSFALEMAAGLGDGFYSDLAKSLTIPGDPVALGKVSALGAAGPGPAVASGFATLDPQLHRVRSWAQVKTGEPLIYKALSLAMSPKYNLSDIQNFVSASIDADWPRVARAVHREEVDVDIPQSVMQKVMDQSDVNPLLVLSVMRVESNFDPDALSPAGARGMMQLMPSTARYVAGLEGLTLASASSLYDPLINVDLGIRYLRKLKAERSIDGNLIYMLVAYNAGPSRARLWQSHQPLFDDPLMVIESIPFRETKNYVKKVLRSLFKLERQSASISATSATLFEGEWPEAN